MAKILGSSFLMRMIRALTNYFSKDSKKSEGTLARENTAVVLEWDTKLPQMDADISGVGKFLIPVREDFDEFVNNAYRIVSKAREFLGQKRTEELLSNVNALILLANRAYLEKDQLLLNACCREIEYSLSVVEEQQTKYYQILDGCRESIEYCESFIKEQTPLEMKSENTPPLYIFIPEIVKKIIDELNISQHIMKLIIQEHAEILDRFPRIEYLESLINIKEESVNESCVPHLQSAFKTIAKARSFLSEAVNEANVRHLHNDPNVSDFFHGGRGYVDSSTLTRTLTSNMPFGVSDLVHFTITSPPVVTCGTNFLIDVWAHLDEQRQEVIERAKEEAGGKNIKIKSKGPVSLARGSVLFVRLKIEGFDIDPSQDTILWEGEIGNATFALTVPSNAEFGSHKGSCGFYVNGLQISSLIFSIDVGRETLGSMSVPCIENRYRRAFVSYASYDNDAVLARIQGMEKASPDMDVFYADESLLSGQKWKDVLRKEILNRDVLYLFWSKAASESEWVDWEWRFGYKEKGLDFIDPVPLVSPIEIPPPPELSDLHFNDWVLAYMRGRHIPK